MKINPRALVLLCIFLVLPALACKTLNAPADTATPPQPPTTVRANTPALNEQRGTLPVNDQRPDLLYVTHKDGSMEIFGMQADGSNNVQLTHTDYVSNWHPAWSPDCTQIAYQADLLKKNFPLIYVMKYGSDEEPSLLLDPEQFMTGEQPSWSPDGRQIAFSGRLQNMGGRVIFIMHADGTQIKPLTDAGSSSLNTCPAWSPDGKKIAYIYTQNGGTHYLMVMNADGSDAKSLNALKNFSYGCPSWSPDSQQIVFVVSGYGITDDLAIINADGSNFTNLTNSTAEEWEPDWSPDGTRIAYMKREGGSNLQIRSMNIDGSDDIALTDDDMNYHFPDWCPLP